MRAYCTVAVVLLGLTACGPELTEPADRDVSGLWTTSQVVSGVGSLTLSMSQSESGRISGFWTGTVVDSTAFPCLPGEACPSDGDEVSDGHLAGSHTVLQLFLDIGGLGTFHGQMISADSIRGAYRGGGSTLSGALGFSRVTF